MQVTWVGPAAQWQPPGLVSDGCVIEHWLLAQHGVVTRSVPELVACPLESSATQARMRSSRAGDWCGRKSFSPRLSTSAAANVCALGIDWIMRDHVQHSFLLKVEASLSEGILCTCC